MQIKKINFFLILCFVFCYCNKKVENYEYLMAYVYDSQQFHWGRGYFKLKVQYEFTYKGKTYKGVYIENKLSKIGAKFYHEGDSVQIKFPEGSIHETTIVGKKVLIQ